MLNNALTEKIFGMIGPSLTKRSSNMTLSVMQRPQSGRFVNVWKVINTIYYNCVIMS